MLVDRAGKAVQPRVPPDACGHYVGVVAAMRPMPWRTVEEVKLRRIESPEAVASGCSQYGKDMFDWEIHLGTVMQRGSRRPDFQPDPVSGRACVYARSKGADGGVLVTGGRLTDLPGVVAALRDARPAEPCSLPRTRWAQLVLMPMHQTAYLELDGCRRLEVWTPSGKVNFFDPPRSVGQAVEAVRP
ncbi:hypothetical protein [Actinomadura gamaensis]|uniref:Uncharacterized protein n=1 Tax=Actinomadura gamaensis TaxID=1763541 RepID=A0ABV9UAG6_9ACTN